MFLFSKNKNMKYDKLAGDVELEEDSPVDNPQSPMQFQRFGLILALTTANILSAVFIFAIFARQGKQAHDMFQTGYPTDFDSARQHIELEQVIFTGSPSYTYAGVEFQHHPAKVQYVGKPSSEIDQAWTDLVSGGEFLITEEEVNTQWPGVNSELWDQEHGGYMVRLEVFQTLGCLDLVRRGLSPAYYNLTDDDHAYSSNDRCIERIRQALMCSGDLTPSPYRYNPGLGHSYIDTENLHTCRNFDRLHRWAQERSSGRLAVKPVHK